MANTKVLLRETVADLGIVGDVVEVAPGYARNYLFPKKIATAATSENVKAFARKRERYQAEVLAKEAATKALVEALAGVSVKTVVKADETGSLYGSVSAGTIVELLSKAGHKVDEKAVRISEAIKSVGTHEVPIHIEGEHFAPIELVVEAEA